MIGPARIGTHLLHPKSRIIATERHRIAAQVERPIIA
jgi:hypothetical protein